MSYVDDLVSRKPEIHSFSQYITNNLADNYVRGLNGKYANRLGKGIAVASETAAENLPAIIQGLISDRMTKSATTKVTSSEATGLPEKKQRALILALWSVRIPKINRDGKIDIENKAVYGNENYIPPVDLSITSPTNNSPNKQDHQPTLKEIGGLLGKLSQKR